MIDNWADYLYKAGQGKAGLGRSLWTSMRVLSAAVNELAKGANQNG